MHKAGKTWKKKFSISLLFEYSWNLILLWGWYLGSCVMMRDGWLPLPYSLQNTSSYFKMLYLYCNTETRQYFEILESEVYLILLVSIDRMCLCMLINFFTRGHFTTIRKNQAPAIIKKTGITSWEFCQNLKCQYWFKGKLANKSMSLKTFSSFRILGLLFWPLRWRYYISWYLNAS